MPIQSARILALAVILAVVAPWAPVAAEPAATEQTPIVVKIHADWCGTCRKLNPTWASLQQIYGDRVRFVVLDVSDRDALAQSMLEADRLGIRALFNAYRSRTGTIAVIDGRTLQAVEVLKGETDPARYAAAIARATES